MLRLLPLLLALYAVPATAAIYKWVDENGKTQYSDKPPPSQKAREGVTPLNGQGMHLKQSQDMMSPEQRAAYEAEQSKDKALKAQQDDIRRKDRALLDSFSNTAEIDRIRDQSLEQLNASIQSEQLRRDGLQRRVDEYQKQADKFIRNKHPVPEMLSDIADRKAEITKIDAEIQQRKQEVQDVKAKAEVDKKRLVQLRGPSALSR